MDGHSRLGARRDHLHRRILQIKSEADLRQGGFVGGPAELFNSSLDGNLRRAIDINEGEEVDAAAFKALIGEAVAVNLAHK